MKNYEISLTRNQEISLILVQILKDPGLTSYFMDVLKIVEVEDSRNFHCSLRRTTSERWEKLNELCKGKNFYQMNPCIPITCDLPFDGKRWRQSKELMKYISYLYPGFIRLEISEIRVTNTGGTYQSTSPIENYEIGVRGGEDIQCKESLESLESSLYLEHKIYLLNRIKKSFGDSGPLRCSISRAYRHFQEIIDKYENFNLSEWEEDDIEDLPELVYNLTTQDYSLINPIYEEEEDDIV